MNFLLNLNKHSVSSFSECPLGQFDDGRDCVRCSKNCAKCINLSECLNCGDNTCLNRNKTCEQCPNPVLITTTTESEESILFTTTENSEIKNLSNSDYSIHLIILLTSVITLITFTSILLIIFFFQKKFKSTKDSVVPPPTSQNEYVDPLFSQWEGETTPFDSGPTQTVYQKGFLTKQYFEGNLIFKKDCIIGEGTYGTVYKVSRIRSLNFGKADVFLVFLYRRWNAYFSCG